MKSAFLFLFAATFTVIASSQDKMIPKLSWEYENGVLIKQTQFDEKGREIFVKFSREDTMAFFCSYYDLKGNQWMGFYVHSVYGWNIFEKEYNSNGAEILNSSKKFEMDSVVLVNNNVSFDFNKYNCRADVEKDSLIGLTRKFLFREYFVSTLYDEKGATSCVYTVFRGDTIESERNLKSELLNSVTEKKNFITNSILYSGKQNGTVEFYDFDIDRNGMMKGFRYSSYMREDWKTLRKINISDSLGQEEWNWTYSKNKVVEEYVCTKNYEVSTKRTTSYYKNEKIIKKIIEDSAFGKQTTFFTYEGEQLIKERTVNGDGQELKLITRKYSYY